MTEILKMLGLIASRALLGFLYFALSFYKYVFLAVLFWFGSQQTGQKEVASKPKTGGSKRSKRV